MCLGSSQHQRTAGILENLGLPSHNTGFQMDYRESILHFGTLHTWPVGSTPKRFGANTNCKKRSYRYIFWERKKFLTMPSSLPCKTFSSNGRYRNAIIRMQDVSDKCIPFHHKVEIISRSIVCVWSWVEFLSRMLFLKGKPDLWREFFFLLGSPVLSS